MRLTRQSYSSQTDLYFCLMAFIALWKFSLQCSHFCLVIGLSFLGQLIMRLWM